MNAISSMAATGTAAKNLCQALSPEGFIAEANKDIYDAGFAYGYRCTLDPDFQVENETDVEREELAGEGYFSRGYWDGGKYGFDKLNGKAVKASDYDRYANYLVV